MFRNRGTLIVLVIAVSAIIISSVTLAYWYNERERGADEDELIIRFFNIGHGLSVLITTPDHKNILIDAGSFDTFKSTVDFLQELDVPRVDAFIITHPHPDHVSYAAEVLSEFDVLAVYMPGNADNLEPEGWAAVMTAVEAEGCPVFNDTILNPGARLDISDEVDFQLMWIDADATQINDSCIVLRLDYLGTSVLLTADIEHAAENAMMDLGLDLDVDILQVAHHGVDSGTSSKFLNVSTPEVAIISCGQGYGIPQVPQPGVVARLQGIPTYTTMFNSMAVVEVNDDDYSVSFL